jgi:hypothetical protein
MLGLVVLLFVAAYLLVSALVTWLAVRWARKHDRRPWLWGGLAAFAMYNLVFWDWIPTVVMHRYYCATEAGFWIYKTPAQWAKENPGVLETLEPWPRERIYGGGKVEFEINGGTVRQYNDRFGSWSKWTSDLNGLLIRRIDNGVVDVRDHNFFIYATDFVAGPGGAGVVWKSWLIRSSCNDERARRDAALESEIIDELRMIERERR